MRRDPHLMAGLNVCEGLVTNKPVAEALGYAYRNPAAAIDQAKAG
jgi:alanine dehydrogenase